jgi:hypothetical protein
MITTILPAKQHIITRAENSTLTLYHQHGVYFVGRCTVQGALRPCRHGCWTTYTAALAHFRHEQTRLSA